MLVYVCCNLRKLMLPCPWSAIGIMSGSCRNVSAHTRLCSTRLMFYQSAILCGLLFAVSHAFLSIVPTVQAVNTAPRLTVGLAQSKPHAGENDSPKESVVIVGAGILGSALALELIQRNSNITVTVVDERPDYSTSGVATRGSWAWLNAYQKQPEYYRKFNQLGMKAWSHHEHLRDLVDWKGSLVRVASPLTEPPVSGEDRREGPLTKARILELEPNCRWGTGDSDSQNEYVYYFRDHGCVDPVRAIEALQAAASEKGVRFMWGKRVTNRVVISDDDDSMTTKLRGIKYHDISSPSMQSHVLEADTVVLAAGVGSSPLVDFAILRSDPPGRIAFCKPEAVSMSNAATLNKILVDTISETHILQRRDGRLVAGGGGNLQVGGETSKELEKLDHSIVDSPQLTGHELMSRALDNMSTLSSNTAAVATYDAVRPMPRDGLPIVGLQRGLYIMVTHSGITLAPVLASCVATEIMNNVEVDELAPFRPGRFR